MPEGGAVEQQREAPAIADRDREILAFERTWWKQGGSKERAVRDHFGMPSSAAVPGVHQSDFDVIEASGKVGTTTVRLFLLGLTGTWADVDPDSPDTEAPEPWTGGMACLSLTRGKYHDLGCASLKATSYKSDSAMDVGTISFSVRPREYTAKVTAKLTFTATSTPELSAAPSTAPSTEGEEVFAAGQLVRRRTGTLTGTITASSPWSTGTLKSGTGSISRTTEAGASIVM